MIRTIAKHKYIKGRQGKDKGRAHINYIAHRDGPDREQGGRKFFDSARENIDASEVKQLMYERADERGVTMHKFVLSPGLDADVKEYTRELMENIGRDKGLELEWRAVIHENTDHVHAHVVVMGKDKEGHLVRFNRDDYERLRQYGDEYLNREHKLERYLDREMQELLRSKDYDRGGDEEFKRLIFGKRDERSDDPERARREFQEFDEKLRQLFEDKRTPELYPKAQEQRTLEQAGRLAEHHGDYTIAMERQRLERILQESPELAKNVEEELAGLREAARENRQHQSRDRGLEQLLGFDYGAERQNRQIDRQAETAYKTFESDRMAKSEQQEQDDSEREDTDPWTGN